MKKSIIIIYVFSCLCSCTSKKQTLQFTAVPKAALNGTPYQMPPELTDSAQKAHDSCMGFTFNANAILAGNKSQLFIGTIINRQSLKKVNTLDDLGLDFNQVISRFNILTNPCYEKRTIKVPLKSLMGDSFNLQMPGTTKAINKEINDAIAAAANTKMETGSWIYFDMQALLRTMLDTATTPVLLQYKKNLLDTANITLMALESVMNISFIISTKQPMSEAMQTFLKTKPLTKVPENKGGGASSFQLFYLQPNKLQIFIDGFFPVVGQFVQAEIK